MKFRAIGFAAVAAGALLLTACASGAASTDAASDGGDSNAPDGLVEAGVATACIDPEYPPLEYYENGSDGEIIGFDADAVRALAEHWGVEAKFEVTSFDGLMPGLQSSRCDFIFGGLYMSEERMQVADAAPIMNAGPAALAAPELAAKLSEPEDLCGLRVVTQAASSNAASVAALSEQCVADGEEAIEQSEYPKTAETVLAVLNGKADVLVETNVAAAYMATQNEGELEVAGVFDPDTTFGVFTRKDDALTPAVAEALQALYEDGTWASIAEQYNLDAEILDVY
jgi:polar amino acid transport system substrate-binding protein